MTFPPLLSLWAALLCFGSLGAGYCVPIGNNFDAQVLRIMPLGASIVYGYDSSDGNGFRQGLRLKLLADGANVNIIGSQRGGSMPDNFVEAVSGYRIDQVSGLADNSIPEQPNLVIIHAGTNDIVQNYQAGTADQRLGALVDKLLAAIPGTVVLVSTLIPNLNPTVNAGIQTLNTKIRELVAQRVSAGKHVHLADMSSILLSDLNTADGTHPTDNGYAKMADVWYSGVQEIAAQCWFNSPAPIAGVNDLAYTTVAASAAPAPTTSTSAAPTEPSSTILIVPVVNAQTSAPSTTSTSSVSITTEPTSTVLASSSQATTTSSSESQSSTSSRVSTTATATLQTTGSTTLTTSTTSTTSASASASATKKSMASAGSDMLNTWTWVTVCMAFVMSIL